MNRFALLEQMDTDFGSGSAGRLLGCWTDRAGVKITDAAGDNVTPADVDAYMNAVPSGVGTDGQLNMTEKVGFESAKIRVFSIAYMVINAAGIGQKNNATMYVEKWGEADELAYWLNKKPEPKPVATGASVKSDRFAFMEALVGRNAPAGITPGNVVGYALGATSAEGKCTDATLRIEVTGGIKIEATILCQTGGAGIEGDPRTFKINAVVE